MRKIRSTGETEIRIDPSLSVSELEVVRGDGSKVRLVDVRPAPPVRSVASS